MIVTNNLLSHQICIAMRSFTQLNVDISARYVTNDLLLSNLHKNEVIHTGHVDLLFDIDVGIFHMPNS